ncbi:hypothetical protein HAX54_050591, partial [Datura stramonium]|nr:hypothetical protein [Datura stramonium]
IGDDDPQSGWLSESDERRAVKWLRVTTAEPVFHQRFANHDKLLSDESLISDSIFVLRQAPDNSSAFHEIPYAAPMYHRSLPLLHF